MRITNRANSSEALIGRKTKTPASKRRGGPSHIEPLEGRILFSTNLLVNGNFSEGNVGFATQYVHNGSGTSGYTVGTNPSKDLKGGFASIGDHTSGSGKMLEADGSTTGTKYVWEESVAVTKGKIYQFSGWDASISQFGGDHIDPNPAKLVLYVNGVKVRKTFSVDPIDGQWGKFSADWGAIVSGHVKIKIVDSNKAEHGNDFALDDLAFSQT
jgi:hypothetical protein